MSSPTDESVPEDLETFATGNSFLLSCGSTCTQNGESLICSLPSLIDTSYVPGSRGFKHDQLSYLKLSTTVIFSVLWNHHEISVKTSVFTNIVISIHSLFLTYYSSSYEFFFFSVESHPLMKQFAAYRKSYKRRLAIRPSDMHFRFGWSFDIEALNHAALFKIFFA